MNVERLPHLRKMRATPIELSNVSPDQRIYFAVIDTMLLLRIEALPEMKIVVSKFCQRELPTAVSREVYDFAKPSYLRYEPLTEHETIMVYAIVVTFLFQAACMANVQNLDSILNPNNHTDELIEPIMADLVSMLNYDFSAIVDVVNMRPLFVSLSVLLAELDEISREVTQKPKVDSISSYRKIVNSISHALKTIGCRASGIGNSLLPENVSEFSREKVQTLRSFKISEDCIVGMGFDAISLKSGWDEYGIAYGRPTENVHIRRVHLHAFSGSALAFGSDMSGGISNVLVEHAHLLKSNSGIEFRTTRGRGGYMKDIVISDIQMENVHTAIAATGNCGSHPDDKFDPNALPLLDHITLRDVTGKNITIAGNLAGIEESPFTNICLSNITLSTNSVSPITWECSNVSGFADSVLPEPCPELGTPSYDSSSSCFYLHSISGKIAVQ